VPVLCSEVGVEVSFGGEGSDVRWWGRERVPVRTDKSSFPKVPGQALPGT
jgi:hypothetical protein